MISGISNLIQNQLNSYNRAQYNKIYTHELSHKVHGGSLTGSIVIEKDKYGTPIGGHVDIQMPVLNRSDPDKTIEQAQTVINSALAPSDPSDEDLEVAQNAEEILYQAQQIKNDSEQGAKLNIVA